MSKKKPQEKKHSKYSASGSHRWLNCPGSIKFCEGMESEESEYALEGTAAHELAAQSLIQKVRPTSLPLRYIEDDRLAALVNEEMREHVEGYYLYVMTLAKGKELLVEKKLSLEFIEKDMFGTTDVSIIEPWGCIDIIDFKYGRGLQVEARENPQVAFYAVAVAHMVDWDFTLARSHIYQPRREHIDIWEKTPHDLKQWVSIFEQGVAATKKKNAPLVAGEWCKFCPGKMTCPSFNNEAKAILPKEIALPEVKKALTPAQVGQILDKADIIEGFLKSAREYAFSLLNKGEKVPGWKLVEKRGQRKWASETKTVDFLRKKELLGQCLEPLSLKSPAQVEKVLKDEKFLDKFLKKHVVYVSSGLTLAREDDSRGEVKAQVEREFEGFEL